MLSAVVTFLCFIMMKATWGRGSLWLVVQRESPLLLGRHGMVAGAGRGSHTPPVRGTGSEVRLQSLHPVAQRNGNGLEEGWQKGPMDL